MHLYCIFGEDVMVDNPYLWLLQTRGDSEQFAKLTCLNNFTSLHALIERFQTSE